MSGVEHKQIGDSIPVYWN